ncbi:MAG: hypothetical protein D6752_03265 [Candidatus Nitrosothermus koennekii]|nr:MAG: hypothetical protein D6752_03265 [Candidatus Nitrosothermus koennekii]
MAEQKSSGSPFTVMALAFIVAIAAGVGYYQFFYLPELSAKPQVPEEVLNPLEVAEVTIIPGSFNQDQPDNFIPKRLEVQLGLNNKVRWTNEDSAPHTVTSDDGYTDPWSGAFDSREHTETPLIMPGTTFEFLFTEPGEYHYHCEPHPWMTGTVVVEELKF